MNKIGVGIFVVVLVLLFIVVTVSVHRSDDRYIQTWAAENGHVIVLTERCYFSLGPFWYRDKSDRIYRVSLQDGKIFWFRFRFFGPNIEEGK